MLCTSAYQFASPSLCHFCLLLFSSTCRLMQAAGTLTDAMYHARIIGFAGTSKYAREGAFLDVMWQALAPLCMAESHSAWSKASPAVKFAVCVERNHVFRGQPGPADMKSRTWPYGRPAEAIDIVRELMAKDFNGIEPDVDIVTALDRWANYKPAFQVDPILTGCHTW